MPTNKQAALRYRCLDELLQDQKAHYTMDQLRRRCAAYVTERTGIEFEDDMVKERTFWDDIRYLRENLNAPIKCHKECGRPYFFKYEDAGFSIYKSSILSTSESQLLLDVVQILGRFKGMPQFDEFAEVAQKLSCDSGYDKECTSVIGFDQNIDVKGQNYFTPLFNRIINKEPVTVVYEPFVGPKVKYSLSPYYLKQFEHRWYVLGRTVEKPEWGILNLALDRIKDLKNCKSKFIENPGIDFEEYFDDIIGVTKKDTPIETVKLKVDPGYVGYFLSKPLHQTMKSKLASDGTTTIKVRINRELENKLLEMSSEVEVLEPLSLRKTIHDRLEKALAMHQIQKDGTNGSVPEKDE